jgi:hypothetical protein
MEEVEIPAVSGETDLEEALMRMRESKRSALVVDLREGPKLLFAEDLLPLRENVSIKVKDVPESVRTVGVPIPGGSVNIPAPSAIRRGLDATVGREVAQYAVVGIKGDRARVVSATGDLSRLLGPLPENM